MQAASKPYWDFEWDYTMGKLEEQPGWSVSSSGTVSSTMTSTGEKLTADNNAYIQPYMQSAGVQAANRYMANGYGVLEMTFYGSFYKSSGAANLRITAAASSTKRVTIMQSGATLSSFRWRVFDNSSPSQGTELAACSDGTYKVRIVFKDTVADIYINDELVKANQSTSTSVYGTSNCVMQQNSRTGYSILKSFKIHQGQ